MTDLRIRRSRAALLNAARELFLVNPSASLSDVAKHAGIGRATLYRHFDSREQIIQALAMESLEATNAALAPLEKRAWTYWQYLTESIKAIMPLADYYHFLLVQWDIAGEDETVKKLYQEQIDGLHELINGAKNEGAINKALDTAFIAQMFDATLYVGWNLVKQQKMSIDDASEQAVLMLSQGLRQ